jgi:hypothetical protein
VQKYGLREDHPASVKQVLKLQRLTPESVRCKQAGKIALWGSKQICTLATETGAEETGGAAEAVFHDE